jgi:tetratricopeptide (TPR) repeat protein
MGSFGIETPAYVFGRKEPIALEGIPPDWDFLEWGERSNAAVIVPAYAEDDLLDSTEAGADAASIQWQFAQRMNRLAATDGLLRYCRMRLPDETPGFVELARAYLDIAGDPARKAAWQEAAALTSQGSRLHHEQPQRALELYTEALRRFETAGDPKGVGKCAGNIGLLYLDNGVLPDAIRLLTEALSLHRRVAYLRGQMMHLFNLAEVYRQVEQWDNVLSALLERRSIGRWVDPTAEALFEAEIASCYHKMGMREHVEKSYRRALMLVQRIQVPAQFDEVAQSLLPLAEAFNDVARLKDLLSSAKREFWSALQALDPRPMTGAGPILERFRAGLADRNESMQHEAVVQNERWSVILVESLLAQSAYYSLRGDHATAALADQLAESLGYQLWKSCLVRWPLDEVKLFQSWTLDNKIAKARAYDAKIRGLVSAWRDELAPAQQLLRQAAGLHELIGDRDAVGPWFPEVFRELGMADEDREARYDAVYRSDAAAEFGDRKRKLDLLMKSLAIAREKGSRINVADKYSRIAIFHHEDRNIPEAAQWFESAEKAFEELEKIGLSAVDEAGRANNKIKLAAHLGEYLYTAGRYSEVAFVLVPALREADWFIASYGNDAGQYLPHVREYKGQILYCLAKNYSRLGGFEKSLEYARQMAAWFEQTGDEAGKAAAHQAASFALEGLQRTSEALAEALADLKIQRRRREPRDVVVALNSVAGRYLGLGQLADAEQAAKESLSLVEDAGYSRTFFLNRLRNNPMLLIFLVSPIPHAVDRPEWWAKDKEQRKADALYTLGEVAAARRDWSEATRLFGQVLEIDEALGAEDSAIITLSSVAGSLLNAGQAAEAARYAEQAWTRSARVQSYVCRYAAGYFLAVCKMTSDLGKDWYDAVDILLEVCRCAEQMRGEEHEEAHKILQSIQRSDPYNRLITVLVTLSEQDAELRKMVFEAVERAKARALVESIAAAARAGAEEQGVRLGSISVYAADPREELVRTGYNKIVEMLRREAGLMTPESHS